MYRRLDKSYFEEPQKLESLINTGSLVQKSLPKQVDIDQILNLYKEKFSKECTYLLL